MVQVDPSRASEYREAWDQWQRQLSRLHEVFLEGERLTPPQLKGLLNREARAKERYDAARAALLGIGGSRPLGGGGAGEGRIGPSIGGQIGRSGGGS